MSNHPTRVRFAPSPTGYLHVGGARTALFNWLFARHTGGTFVLRIEDTDDKRNTPEANAAIFEGLDWLGLDWDEGPSLDGHAQTGDVGPYRQSLRNDIYDRYLAQLQEAGAVYDDEGAIRFKAPNTPVTVDDLICGPTEFKDREEPDMTIRRPDGSYIFHFVSVVDDIEMKISHIIRGEDHLSNTPRHFDLYAALGATPPCFAHIPLILNQDGSKMSKRDKGASIREYIDQGFLSPAIVNYLALLGWSPGDDREVLSPGELVQLFDLPDVNRSNARFDFEKCRWMNQKYIQALSDDEFIAKARSGFLTHDLPDEALLLAKPRAETLADVDGLLTPLIDQSATVPEDPAAKVRKQSHNADLLSKLADALEALPAWTEDSIKDAVAQTAGEFDLKPGKVMFPLRITATGAAHGVDLIPSLLIIGQTETARHIRARTTSIFSE